MCIGEMMSRSTTSISNFRQATRQLLVSGILWVT
jgi:hypothetical protein